MLKVSATITSSPKKVLVYLEEQPILLNEKDEHENVSVNKKVLNVLDPKTAPTGKKYKL